MAVDAQLAQLSDHLFSGAVLGYSVALLLLIGDYALTKSERRAEAKAAARLNKKSMQRTPALVGADAPPGIDHPTDAPELADDLDVPTDLDAPSEREPSAWGPRLGAWGFAATVIALLVQIASLTTRGLAAGRLPWGNMFEFASAIVICFVATYIVLAWRTPSRRFLGTFVLPVAIAILLFIGLRFYAETGPVVAALRSYWLAIHVSAASIAAGVMFVSAVASALYLIREKHESNERASDDYVPSRIAGALPSARTLDRLAARTMAFAFPVWTFAIIAGAIWAEAAWGRYWGWDPKETWAFISWVVYAGYLHSRSTAGLRGRWSAWINLLGAATMLFNFVIVNTLISGLHSYA